MNPGGISTINCQCNNGKVWFHACSMCPIVSDKGAYFILTCLISLLMDVEKASRWIWRRQEEVHVARMMFIFAECMLIRLELQVSLMVT